MPETKQEVRYQWIRPILGKEISIKNVVKVCPFSERALKYWLSRYRNWGMKGLVDQTTKPHHSPNKTPAWIRQRILDLREEKKVGGKKIHWFLAKEGIKIAERTVNKILKQEGKTRAYRSCLKRENSFIIRVMGKVFIGTSGWSYEHWQGVFYPQDLPKSQWLEYYCQHFRTVEINASFYHLPKPKTFENWRKRTGKDFVFSVKGSRYITHIKKLKDCRESVKRFFQAASGLHSRSGLKGLSGSEVVLWQLPPGLKVNVERLKGFLGLLPKTWRHTFEFRSSTWLTVKIFDLLRRYHAAVVFQDFEHWPITEEVTSDFIYLRFHGKKELYASCYTKKELENWAKKMQNWLKSGLDIYAYFNNDMRAYAVKNAQELISLI